MYALTPARCNLPPLRRAPCRPAASTTTTSTTITTTQNPAALGRRAAANPDYDSLRSTWQHRAWTAAGTAAVLSSLSASASLAASDGASYAPLIVSAIAAYSLADLATGVYHWLVDNYGSPSTAVFGAQIAAFQGHHRVPATITHRDPCNNLHALARAAAFLLPPTDLALSAAHAPASAHAFAATFAACVVLSQQSHAWAHESRRRLPPAVLALQAAGVLVSRAQHGRHHRPPYDTNYCIVSGMWNGVLDQYRVFEALEMVIFFRTGIRPRSWDETQAEWREEDAVDAATAGDDADSS